MLLRGARPAVQDALLGATGWGSQWKARVEHFYRLVWRPERQEPSQAAAYLVFSINTSLWYAGKADAQRWSNSRCWSGLVLRAREHLVATVLRNGPQSHRPRYRRWSELDGHGLFFLPGAHGERSAVFAFERMTISALQAPTQLWHARSAPQERREARPFPRFRTPPTITRERQLNLSKLASRQPDDHLRAWGSVL